MSAVSSCHDTDSSPGVSLDMGRFLLSGLWETAPVPAPSVESGVVLAQEVLAIVIAVGRAHHGVHVVLLGLVVIQEDPGMVVVLDDQHRTVDLVVARFRFA